MFYTRTFGYLFLLLFFMYMFTHTQPVFADIQKEEILLSTLQTAKTKKQKLNAATELLSYYQSVSDNESIISLSQELLKDFKLSKKQKYDLYRNLAKMYQTLDKFEDAVEAAQEAEYLYPKRTEIKLLLGEIYKDHSLYELAANKFKETLELDENNVIALTGLGDIYNLQENYKTALVYYQKALDIEKEMPVTVYINIAVSYKEIGFVEQALKVLENGNIKRENKRVNLLLAEIYKNKKEFVKAQEKLLPFVYKKEDTDIEIYCNLAQIYILSQDYEKSKNLLLYYKSEKENNETIDFLLAESYYGLNNKNEALKIINNILIYTKSEYIKDMINRTLIFEKSRNKYI